MLILFFVLLLICGFGGDCGFGIIGIGASVIVVIVILMLVIVVIVMVIGVIVIGMTVRLFLVCRWSQQQLLQQWSSLLFLYTKTNNNYDQLLVNKPPTNQQTRNCHNINKHNHSNIDNHNHHNDSNHQTGSILLLLYCFSFVNITLSYSTCLVVCLFVCLFACLFVCLCVTCCLLCVVC